MALSMARPWKHPASGFFWFRKRVPDDLKAIVGKREERFSLGTREPQEAKRLHAIKLAEIEERWANLRRGKRALASEEIAHQAREIGSDIRRHLSANPHQTLLWDIEVGASLWAKSTISSLDVMQPLPKELSAKMDQRSLCFDLVDERLKAAGLSVEAGDRQRIAEATSIELQRVAQEHHAYLRGLLLPHTPSTPGIMSPIAATAPLPFEEVIKGWLSEKKPIKKTEYVWRRVMKELSEHLGHDDVRRIRSEDLISWKAALLAKGLKAKTIRDGKLAPVRAILQWATDNRKIPANPGTRVNIDLKARSSEKRRGYNDDEARIILSAARKEKEAYRRWAPWVCAYTGARIAEVCQLRREDVRKIDGIDCIAFAAEAGSLKNINSERVVPIHAALQSEGFLKFVGTVKSGPLFPDLPPDRFDSRGGTGAKALSKWIRLLGLTDKRISPNHSWRHRLKTLGRRHGLAGDIMDAMTGHGRKTVADTYGEFPLEAMMRELAKIPVLQLSEQDALCRL